MYPCVSRSRVRWIHNWKRVQLLQSRSFQIAYIDCIETSSSILIYNRIVWDVPADNLIVNVLNFTFVSQARSWWKKHPRVWCFFPIASANAHTRIQHIHIYTVYSMTLLLHIYTYVLRNIRSLLFQCLYVHHPRIISSISFLPDHLTFSKVWCWWCMEVCYDILGFHGRSEQGGGLIKTKPMGWKLERWTKVRCSPWML